MLLELLLSVNFGFFFLQLDLQMSFGGLILEGPTGVALQYSPPSRAKGPPNVPRRPIVPTTGPLPFAFSLSRSAPAPPRHTAPGRQAAGRETATRSGPRSSKRFV
jgi:hypothetical protein